MKVRISTIPYEGLEIKTPLPLEALNTRLAEGDSAGIEINTAPDLDLKLTRTHTGAEVVGTITCTLKQPCSTCDIALSRTERVNIHWILQPETPEMNEDDIGLLTYTGDHIDLEDSLQEALILKLSPFWHPARKADGSCSQCDRQCSEVAWTDQKSEMPRGLGELLKRAVSKN